MSKRSQNYARKKFPPLTPIGGVWISKISKGGLGCIAHAIKGGFLWKILKILFKTLEGASGFFLPLFCWADGPQYLNLRPRLLHLAAGEKAV